MKRILPVFLSIATVLAIAACGGSHDEATESAIFDTRGRTSGPAGIPGLEAPAMDAIEVEAEMQSGEGAFFGGINPPSEPSPSSAPELKFDSGADGDANTVLTGGAATGGTLETEIAAAAEDRIIVRTVELGMTVDNVSDSVTQISRLATTLGGWVVSTEHFQVHTARIAIRVPSTALDDAIRDVKGIASEVKTEVSSSRDFTEEYTDTNARIDTLQRTLESLRALFDRAEAVEDAIAVQQEITRVQSDLESLQARVKFLAESSAFSLVTINLTATPKMITPNAGEDMTAAVGELSRFRVTFTPGEGYDEEFEILWDFGDGSNKVRVTNVAPTSVEGEYISAPVSHIYGDDKDSPYIATAEITATGQAGVAEGDDKVVVTVSRIPVIEVFAGDRSLMVEEGNKVEFRGSFTRPEGLTDLTYEWDFGDGTQQEPIALPDGATTAEATHTYENFRINPYTAVLTVKGQSPAGPAESMGQVAVFVSETDDSLSPGSFASGSLDALQAVGASVLGALIVVGIFSPVWVLVLVMLYLLWRRYMRPRSPQGGPASTPTPEAETE